MRIETFKINTLYRGIALQWKSHTKGYPNLLISVMALQWKTLWVGLSGNLGNSMNNI